jgi:hypothetical protein
VNGSSYVVALIVLNLLPFAALPRCSILNGTEGLPL